MTKLDDFKLLEMFRLGVFLQKLKFVLLYYEWNAG
jgi:hypothetical protein